VDEEKKRERVTTKFIRSVRTKRALERLREGFSADRIRLAAFQGVGDVLADAPLGPFLLPGRSRRRAAARPRASVRAPAGGAAHKPLGNASAPIRCERMRRFAGKSLADLDFPRKGTETLGNILKLLEGRAEILGSISKLSEEDKGGGRFGRSSAFWLVRATSGLRP